MILYLQILQILRFIICLFMSSVIESKNSQSMMLPTRQIPQLIPFLNRFFQNLHVCYSIILLLIQP